MTRAHFRSNVYSQREALAADPAWSFGRLVGLLIVFSLLLADLAAGQEPVTVNPFKGEAAFLRNFAHYVTWPQSAFADNRSPWHICVLGKDPFGEVLKTTLAGRTEQGRSFEICSAESLKQLPACHIVFIAFVNPERRRAALAELKGKPVLTVGNAPEFLREGGIIRLQVGNRVQMSVNLDQARRGSLAIQTKMLEVSSEVVENGMVKRTR